MRDLAGIKSFIYYWAPIIAYCLFIFWQSSYPSPVKTPHLPFMDKILHGIAYALMGFLFFRALRTSHIGNRTILLIVLSSILATIYGVSDEIHQHFVVSRTADINDVLADGAGSILGAWGAHMFYSLKLQRHNRGQVKQTSVKPIAMTTSATRPKKPGGHDETMH